MAGINVSNIVGWKLTAIAAVVILVLPTIFVGSQAFLIDFDNWSRLSSKLLPLYIKNTGLLLIGVSVLTLLIGISTAWVVTVYEFPFRKYFEWVLILPLSIPTFLNAIAYVGLTDYAGPIRILLRSFNADRYFDIMDHSGAVFVMGMVLYPYIYVAARAAFMLQSTSLIEVSRSLGKSMSHTFRKVVIPTAWPAIFSGLILVIMEVLNDYGVVQYFGIPTFTIGIFRSWLALGDLPSAVLLSFVVLVFVIILVVIDTLIQRKRRVDNDREDRVFTRLKPQRKWMLFALCFVPAFFGFIIPVCQMLWWAVLSFSGSIWLESLRIAGNTFVLGALSAFLVAVIAIILVYTFRVSSKSQSLKAFLKLPMVGYAIPGSVIGIGIVGLIVWINPNWIYSGIIALVFGYTVRFFAVGYGSIETGFDRIPNQLDLAASSLGKKSLARLLSIHLPILKPVLTGAIIMVFIDVAKELPLTLILRPFNFETLATDAFQYAKDEMAPKSASSSLLIIFVSAIPVYFLNKLLIRRSA